MFNPGDTFPYIGLRPFSEEESLYFKGRDEQILQLTALLEANKFLMVTGASGDGKSSLVYAGLVPNARAGFFNATFTNWVVADFRPERTPLYNLSKTISRTLRIGNEESVEIELRRGFSSLVQLYTASSLFVDEHSEAWINASGDEKEEMHRKAANLLIVTDQFEEFFTNPENYYRNAPSEDSQLVINLLLETIRISIEKSLPIYIVCTMRSDYIGQCAAFRGLPEFIGFSQFFVPRLKRKEMVQVAKEPAFLHGDRISDRLVERVVYDLGEGIDQLPVLEHAMNEVWIQAQNGKEELDLIHYAMAGGMSVQELPVTDRERFQSWFNALPSNLRQAYQHPGLAQIIDTHANKLYFSAADHYNQSHDQKIGPADAQLIIRVAFTCLTKMDEGRAVRNRMTLQEITDILARPHLSCDVVGGVLNIFREPGNTFLRPYIDDDLESKTLTPDSVLDITHESLIRNWDLLTQWAKEEYDHLTVYEDFKKQLDRWRLSKKSGGFLLSIGPLTYFESWYEKLNPNPYWINRYLDPGVSTSARLAEARLTIDESKEFLRKSAATHRVTRLVVRYGAARIAGIAAVIALSLLGIYYYLDARSKENEQVIKRVLAEGEEFLPDARVIAANKANFLIISEFLRPGSFKRMVDKLPDPMKVVVSHSISTEFAWEANKSNPPLRKKVLLYSDSVLGLMKNPSGDQAYLTARLKSRNMLIIQTSQYLYFFQDDQVRAELGGSLAEVRELIMNALVEQKQSRPSDAASVNDGLEHLLTNHLLSTDDAQKIVLHISPFEGQMGRDYFNKIYPVDIKLPVSRGGVFAHNGGYQELAYLYSMLGKIDNVKSCLDSLFKYNPIYPRYNDGALQIASYLYRYHHNAELKEFISYYSLIQKTKPVEFYERMLNVAGLYSMDFSNKMWIGENHCLSLELFDEEMMTGLFDLYEAELTRTFTNPDDLHYNMALYFKHRGAVFSKMAHDKHSNANSSQIDQLFLKSVEEYRKVTSNYLQQEISIFEFGRTQSKFARRILFLYPDHAQKVFNRMFWVPKYYSVNFLKYLVEHNLIAEFYKDEKDLDLINTWLKNYANANGTNDTSQEEKNYTPLEEEDLVFIENIFTTFAAKEKHSGIGNFARLLLIHQYLATGAYNKIEPLYQKLDIDKFSSNLNEHEYISTLVALIVVNSFSTHLNELIEYLASQGRHKEANRIIAEYTNQNNRIKAYADATRGFRRFPSTKPNAIYPYLDSAMVETDRWADFKFTSTDPRFVVAYALGAVGNDKYYRLSQSYVKQLSLNAQTDIVQRWIQGIAESQRYYQAFSSIPEITILSERLYLYNLILLEDALRKNPDKDWKLWIEKRREGFYQEEYGYELATF